MIEEATSRVEAAILRALVHDQQEQEARSSTSLVGIEALLDATVPTAGPSADGAQLVALAATDANDHAATPLPPGAMASAGGADGTEAALPATVPARRRRNAAVLSDWRTPPSV